MRTSFRPHAEEASVHRTGFSSEFNDWVKKTQKEAPKLTKNQYDELMLPQHADEMTFSSTHLKYVNQHSSGVSMRTSFRPHADEASVHRTGFSSA